MTFIRFVVGTNQERASQQSGVVTELRLLKESGDLPEYEHAHVEEIFEWLNEHLPVPPFSDAQWPRDAVAWFKPGARSFISKFREIIAILEEHGRFVRTMTTSDPGIIRYEDEYQVVASSWQY
ncbi:hypothetical protein [Brevifollis gellanilyticus]|uniref:Uncharacterized protein n=1 Tax=Brevifollis gellanilyticus TaxID=748831 RepID=A0A512MGY1_9BACT|nr:hypothetical protein [Brevifollis gellanilyticus]GEP45966.1 hypothetical protein BGE01nite_52570 [Brevifollis gellanilyticus]